LLVSHGVPVAALEKSELKVKAARRAPSLLRKIPTEVLTVWM